MPVNCLPERPSPFGCPPATVAQNSQSHYYSEKGEKTGFGVIELTIVKGQTQSVCWNLLAPFQTQGEIFAPIIGSKEASFQAFSWWKILHISYIKCVTITNVRKEMKEKYRWKATVWGQLQTSIFFFFFNALCTSAQICCYWLYWQCLCFVHNVTINGKTQLDWTIFGHSLVFTVQELQLLSTTDCKVVGLIINFNCRFIIISFCMYLFVYLFWFCPWLKQLWTNCI